MSHFCTPWKRQKTYGFQGVYKHDIGLKWVNDQNITQLYDIYKKPMCNTANLI